MVTRLRVRKVRTTDETFEPGWLVYEVGDDQRLATASWHPNIAEALANAQARFRAATT